MAACTCREQRQQRSGAGCGSATAEQAAGLPQRRTAGVCRLKAHRAAGPILHQHIDLTVSLRPPHETARPGEYLFYTMYMDQLIAYRSTWYIENVLALSKISKISKTGQKGVGPDDDLLPVGYNREQQWSRFRKVVPDNIQDLLVDPISLAVWYLDDGSKRSNCTACRLATQGFSLVENMALTECLGINFGIEAKIDTWMVRRPGRPIYGLSLPSTASGYRRLRSLIRPLVEKEIPTMLYKLQ